MPVLVLGLGCCQHPAPMGVDGRVTHVVVFYLKQPGDEAARRKFIESAHALSSIPGVLDVHVGTTLPSTRPVVDASFDVAVVMHFADEASLRNYAVHPDHVRVVNELIKPLVDHYRVYDLRDR